MSSEMSWMSETLEDSRIEDFIIEETAFLGTCTDSVFLVM